MKKVISVCCVIALCLFICACSNNNDIPTAVVPTDVPVVPTDYSNILHPDQFSGTWQATGIVADGVSLSIAELNTLGVHNIDNFYVTIKNGGKAFLSSNGEFIDWSISDNVLILGEVKCSFEDGIISIEDDNIILKLEKISDSQEIVVPETYPSPVIDEAQNTVSGLRPEFKEAMDAYEAFYDEYCTFMQNYLENPTDITLILKYTEMLNELEKMSTSFDAWDEAEMSNEELKYYLDVSNRVMQKLLEVTG